MLLLNKSKTAFREIGGFFVTFFATNSWQIFLNIIF